ncbi:hypothetical protein JNK13_03220 [bacterium]|nr:hypothetical protein [bacterium]
MISFLDEGQVSREENWNPDKPIFFEQATVRIEKWDLNSPPAPSARENYLNEGRFWRSAEEEDQAPKAGRNLERILQPSMP